MFSWSDGSNEMLLVENVDNVVNDMKKGVGVLVEFFQIFTTTQDENCVKICINTKLLVEDTLLVFCKNLILFLFNRNC